MAKKPVCKLKATTLTGKPGEFVIDARDSYAFGGATVERLVVDIPGVVTVDDAAGLIVPFIAEKPGTFNGKAKVFDSAGAFSLAATITLIVQADVPVEPPVDPPIDPPIDPPVETQSHDTAPGTRADRILAGGHLYEVGPGGQFVVDGVASGINIGGLGLTLAGDIAAYNPMQGAWSRWRNGGFYDTVWIDEDDPALGWPVVFGLPQTGGNAGTGGGVDPNVPVYTFVDTSGEAPDVNPNPRPTPTRVHEKKHFRYLDSFTLPEPGAIAAEGTQDPADFSYCFGVFGVLPNGDLAYPQRSNEAGGVDRVGIVRPPAVGSGERAAFVRQYGDILGGKTRQTITANPTRVQGAYYDDVKQRLLLFLGSVYNASGVDHDPTCISVDLSIGASFGMFRTEQHSQKTRMNAFRMPDECWPYRMGVSSGPSSGMARSSVGMVVSAFEGIPDTREATPGATPKIAIRTKTLLDSGIANPMHLPNRWPDGRFVLCTWTNYNHPDVQNGREPAPQLNPIQDTEYHYDQAHNIIGGKGTNVNGRLEGIQARVLGSVMDNLDSFNATAFVRTPNAASLVSFGQLTDIVPGLEHELKTVDVNGRMVTLPHKSYGPTQHQDRNDPLFGASCPHGCVDPGRSNAGSTGDLCQMQRGYVGIWDPWTMIRAYRGEADPVAVNVPVEVFPAYELSAQLPTLATPIYKFGQAGYHEPTRTLFVSEIWCDFPGPYSPQGRVHRIEVLDPEETR
jgi:hypothetical protein